MDAPLDPLISEFEAEAQAASYDRWFRAKVAEALGGGQPRLPRVRAVARVEALPAETRDARAYRSTD